MRVEYVKINLTKLIQGANCIITKSRGSAVEFRHNSHYGKSPIAYPPKRYFSWAVGEK